jgi:hypothetical protein
MGSYSCDCSNLFFGGLISYKIVDIGLNLIESYPTKVTNSIDYFGGFGTE